MKELSFWEKILIGAVGGFVLLLVACQIQESIGSGWALALYATGAIFSGTGAGVYYLREYRLYRRLQIAGVRKAEAEAQAAETGALYHHESGGMGSVVWGREMQPAFYTRPFYGGTHSGPGTADVSVNPESLPDVVRVIDDSIVCMLIAPQGSGKTSLLNHLQVTRPGRQIIIDPHSENPQAIMEYPDIEVAMCDLIAELRRRYRVGHSKNHERLNIYVDELTLLNKYCPSFQDFMKTMLTECRKVNIRVVACTHSKSARTVGLQGSYDLAEGIVWVRLRRDLRTGKHYADVEAYGEKFEVAMPYLPGPSGGQTVVNRTSHPSESPVYDAGTPDMARYDTTITTPPGIGYDPDAGEYIHEPPPRRRIFESRNEKQVVDDFENGASLSALAKRFFRYSNGVTVGKVKAILEKHNLL